ncbi:MAG: hypothetical protein ACLQNE_12345 [Thermoguttaceae bacterium]
MSQEERNTLYIGYVQMLGVRLRRKRRGRAQPWWSDAEHREIRSGAIIPDSDAPGCFLIDANTVQGLRQSRQSQEITTDDPQSEEGRFAIRNSVYVVVLQVKPWSSEDVFVTNRIPWAASFRRSLDTRSSEGSATPVALISKIASETASREEKRRAVIESEVVAFLPHQAVTLNRLLRRFIEQYRNSDDQQDVAAVGAAIRKYVATMNRDDLSALAILLDAEHNATVPIEVELEVAKTLVRRLIQSPPEEPDCEPSISDRLYEIVRTYLNPRLLSRDKVAAVALNAVLALCLLRSRHTSEMVSALKRLRVSWFSELVVRRASQIRNTLRERLPTEQAERFAEQLAALIG